MKMFALLFVWLALWLACSVFMSKMSRSKIISVGGGFLASTVAFMLLAAVFIKYDMHKREQSAMQAGFSSFAEYKEWDKKGFSTKAEVESHLTAMREDREEKDKRRAAAESAGKSEEKYQAQIKLAEANGRCDLDLECSAEKSLPQASAVCQNKIERLSKYDFEWVDGFLESKFSRYRWTDSGKTVVTYIGDKIKLQNGFGAWQFYTYECDFSIGLQEVKAVRASPGRLNY